MDKCPACGAPLEQGTKVCGECGADVLGVTASFPPIAEETGAQPAVGAVEGPVLVVQKGPEVGERFYVDRARLVIGRDPSSDVFLNDITVSRAHAVVELVGGVVTIKDSGSLNGTYVNGVLVDSATLTAGDCVQIGRFQMLFADSMGA